MTPRPAVFLVLAGVLASAQRACADPTLVLDGLVLSAELVVAGRVTGVEERGGLTAYAVEVEQTIHGNAAGPRLEVHSLGKEWPDAPSLEPGREYLLGICWREASSPWLREALAGSAPPPGAGRLALLVNEGVAPLDELRSCLPETAQWIAASRGDQANPRNRVTAALALATHPTTALRRAAVASLTRLASSLTPEEEGTARLALKHELLGAADTACLAHWLRAVRVRESLATPSELETARALVAGNVKPSVPLATAEENRAPRLELEDGIRRAVREGGTGTTPLAREPISSTQLTELSLGRVLEARRPSPK